MVNFRIYVLITYNLREIIFRNNILEIIFIRDKKKEFLLILYIYIFRRIGYCCHLSWLEKKIQFHPIAVNSVMLAISFLSCVTRKGTAKFTPFRVKAAGRHRNAFLKSERPIEFHFAPEILDSTGDIEGSSILGWCTVPVFTIPSSPRLPRVTPISHFHSITAATATITSASSTLVLAAARRSLFRFAPRHSGVHLVHLRFVLELPRRGFTVSRPRRRRLKLRRYRCCRRRRRRLYPQGILHFTFAD